MKKFKRDLKDAFNSYNLSQSQVENDTVAAQPATGQHDRRSDRNESRSLENEEVLSQENVKEIQTKKP